MYRLERVAREIYNTIRPDGSIDSLGRYTVARVPSRPCSNWLHSGPLFVYLEDYVFTEDEKASILVDSHFSGGISDSLPNRRDLVTVALGGPIHGQSI